MDTLTQFISEYSHSTDPPIVVLQVVLFAGSVGAMAAGLLHCVARRTELPHGAIRRIRRLSVTVASLAPLVGILGTVLGAQDIPLAISEGRLQDVGSGLGMALTTTAAGVVTACVAIVAAELLRIPREVRDEP